MSPEELQRYLDRFDLKSLEAAQLLGVSVRTIQRWRDGERIPISVVQTLRAWARLEKFGVPWKPDLHTIRVDDQRQIALLRDHDVWLAEIVDRVSNRGGPVRWEVNFVGGVATLGPMEVYFYRLRNGGFSPSYYARRDMEPDVDRDAHYIEDAIVCIAQELKNDLSQASEKF